MNVEILWLFDGSGNETMSALMPYDDGNAESFNIGWNWNKTLWNLYGGSWKNDLDQSIDPRFDSTFPVARITEIDPEFIGKWEIDENLESHRESARERQRKLKKKWDEVYGSNTDEEEIVFEQTSTIRIPEDLYDHQKVGLGLWQESGMRGILEYATGSGKTITAIAAIKQIVDTGNNAIVLVPSEHLLFQWYEEIERFIPKSTIGLLGGGEKEDEMLNEMRFRSEQGSILISIIHSFRSTKVQKKLRKATQDRSKDPTCSRRMPQDRSSFIF